MVSLCGFNLYFPSWHEIEYLFICASPSVKFLLGYFVKFSGTLSFSSWFIAVLYYILDVNFLLQLCELQVNMLPFLFHKSSHAKRDTLSKPGDWKSLAQASVRNRVQWLCGSAQGRLWNFEWVASSLLTTADLWCLPLQVEQEDFVMEGHGKTPPPGEESKQWVTVYLKRVLLQIFRSTLVKHAESVFAEHVYVGHIVELTSCFGGC